MNKVLVTGGAGFIGSTLVDSLLKQGMFVVVLDDLSCGKREYVNSKAGFVKMSITDEEVLPFFEKEKFDYVFHLAAQRNVRVSIARPKFDADINILGTLNILEACRQTKVKKVVFSSTGGAIYGDADIIPTSENQKTQPLSPYAIAKFAVEEYFKFFYKVNGLNYVSLRYSNVYGPRQDSSGEGGVISVFCKKIIKKELLPVFGSGGQTRDFVYVADVVRANVLAMQSDYCGQINISSQLEISVNQIVKELAKISGKNISGQHIESVKGEVYRSCLNNRLAEEVLKWSPKVDFNQGLSLTFEWIQKNLASK